MRKQPAKKAPSALRLRLVRHLESLGHDSVPMYVAWCRAHGFEASVDKCPTQIEAEALAHAQNLERARLMLRAGRDPRRLVELAFSGDVRTEEVRAPEWRTVCERVQAAGGDEGTRRSLRQLVLKVLDEADFLGDTATFGDRRHPYIDGLIELSRRRGQWIRPLESWTARTHNRRRQFSSLVRHLLALYPVPTFMDSAWLSPGASFDCFRDWFILIGSGENVRKAPTPIPLTKRMAHTFLEAPDHYSIENALRFGQVHALGGDFRLTEALVATRLGASFEHEDFWVTVIRFFAQNPLLDRRHVGPIVDYLQHQRFETRAAFVAPGVRERLPPPQPNLSMNGRTADALLRQVEKWHRELGRAKAAGQLRWESSGIGPFELETGKGKTLRVWRIRELLSSSELQEEGRAMRHCVASYAHSCTAGRCSIWAMEVESHEGTEKRQTIEINGQRVIIQSRGRCNALPAPQDLEVLQRWATEQRLQVSSRLIGR